MNISLMISNYNWLNWFNKRTLSILMP